MKRHSSCSSFSSVSFTRLSPLPPASAAALLNLDPLGTCNDERTSGGGRKYSCRRSTELVEAPRTTCRGGGGVILMLCEARTPPSLPSGAVHCTASCPFRGSVCGPVCGRLAIDAAEGGRGSRGMAEGNVTRKLLGIVGHAAALLWRSACPVERVPRRASPLVAPPFCAGCFEFDVLRALGRRASLRSNGRNGWAKASAADTNETEEAAIAAL